VVRTAASDPVDGSAQQSFGIPYCSLCCAQHRLHASVQFFVVGLGGNVVGLAVGWSAEQFHKRVDDAPIEITVPLLTPFVAYLAAERLGFSGVLAVVTSGWYFGMRMPELLSFKTRLRGGPVWEMLEFLLNGFVFILIGLQLPEVLSALSGHSIPFHRLIWNALLISLAVIVIRILWGLSRDLSAAPALQEAL
jgi:NhaP-type Na+/H+ or K+/H+ antiporter